jgi:hypothetical protein
MKCERCGCEMAETDNYAGKHENKMVCITSLQCENSDLQRKLAERPTNETKPERFERLRELISHSGGYAGFYPWDYLVDEVKDLLAAHTEAKILMIEHNRPIFCGDDFANWLQKWA